MQLFVLTIETVPNGTWQITSGVQYEKYCFHIRQSGCRYFYVLVIKYFISFRELINRFLTCFDSFLKNKGEVALKEMEVKKQQLLVATEEAQSYGNQKMELGNIVKKKKQALKFTQVRHWLKTMNNLTHLRPVPASIYLFKVNRGNTRTLRTIKAPGRHHRRRSGDFIVNSEYMYLTHCSSATIIDFEQANIACRAWKIVRTLVSAYLPCT